MAVNVLSNKYVFYAIFFIAMANLLGYLAMEDYESLTFFVAIYALSTYFSKNTIVNLSVAILGTAVVRTPGRKKVWPWREREGMETREGNSIIKKLEDEEKALTKAATKTTTTESMANAPKAATEEEEEIKSNNLMALGTNIKKQYGELQEKLGKGGLSALTSDTTQLANTQKDLMEQMENMAPLMQNAEKLLKTFESSGMMKMVDRILPFVEKIALPGTGPTKGN